MSKIKTGIQLIKDSIRFAKNARGLYLFPIASAICMLTAIGCFVAISYFYAGSVESLLNLVESNKNSVPVIVGGFASAFVMLFVSIFFNVALLGSIHAHLEEKPSSFSLGLTFALSKTKIIFYWSCVSFFVGNMIAYIFRPFTEHFPIIKSLVGSLLGIAWGVATYFVIPVMIFESHSKVKDIMKESASLMQDKFSEQITAKLYIGAVYIGVSILLFVIFLIGIFASIVTAMGTSPILSYTILGFTFGLLVIGMLVLTLITNMTYSVLNVVLYQYAKNGTFPKQFESSRVALGY